MSSVIHAFGHALSIIAAMTWEILWALILGFFLAAVVESVVSKRRVSRLLPNARPRSLATAAGLGIASSSCSYAAVALARALFRKGANFTAAISFQIASTNLVIELGAILWLLVGWQFTLAEYVGGIVMIVVVASAMRLVISDSTTQQARQQAQEGLAGSMEGHAAMDMTVGGDASVLRKIVSRQGWTSISDNFVMEWAATLRDIAIGLVIAGAVAAWVPDHFWQSFFLTDHPTLSKLWGPIIGPVVAMLTFVCSIGNVPLAGVLWNDGISFGGVVSFLFADLIILPIILIYRKYYGAKAAALLTLVLWLAAVISGYVVELAFGALGLIPDVRAAHIMEHATIAWNYKTYLNIGALVLAAALVITFWRKGSWSMLKMMNGSPDQSHEHSCHAPADEHDHQQQLDPQERTYNEFDETVQDHGSHTVHVHEVPAGRAHHHHHH